VLSQSNGAYTLAITFYPLNDAVRKAREEQYAKSQKDDPKYYLASTPTCNWDAKMRADLITDLAQNGIFPQLLSDTQLVEQVSRWAMDRSKDVSSSSGMPIAWYVDFPRGEPQVYPPLKSEFDAEKPDPSWTEQRQLDSQVLGKAMFYQKCHGDCTSTAIYLATILRALGVPTRIVYFIPPCDGNDSRQVAMLTSAIHHHVIAKQVEDGLNDCHGFCNHMYDEVFIDNRWVRLNYTTLGQNIVDSNYDGLLAHIATCRDISETNLAATWGIRSATWPHVSEPMTSINPFMLIRAWDHFGRYAQLENPGLPKEPDLTDVTVNRISWRGTDGFRALLPDSYFSQLPASQAPDFMIDIAEFLPGQDYHQLERYLGNASRSFILHSPGHPDIHAELTGLNCNNEAGQGFGARVADTDRDNISPGTVYTLEPRNTSTVYEWTVAQNVTLAVPAK